MVVTLGIVPWALGPDSPMEGLGTSAPYRIDGGVIMSGSRRLPDAPSLRRSVTVLLIALLVCFLWRYVDLSLSRSVAERIREARPASHSNRGSVRIGNTLYSLHHNVIHLVQWCDPDPVALLALGLAFLFVVVATGP